MIYLNGLKLPEPIAAAIRGDSYHEKRQAQLADYCQKQGIAQDKVLHFSVSDLISPPRRRVLTRRYWDKIIKDVSQDIYRILGQAVHAYLAQHCQNKYIPEERIFHHRLWGDKIVVISGEPDLVTPAGEIHDYKVAAVYSWQKAQEEGVKSEWETQLNLYAWLHIMTKDQKITGLKNHLILRDFKLSETVQENYPKAGIQVIDVPLWSLEQTEEYVQERMRLHVQAEAMFDDELPECSAYEMWEKPEAWAVQRQGASRAAKLVRVAGDEGNKQATEIAAEKNLRLKKDEQEFMVEHRPGERGFCEKFCNAAGFCNQFMEYKGATYK